MTLDTNITPRADWYDDEPDEETQGDDLHTQLVRDEVRKLRAREAAREILAAERVGSLDLPPLVSLEAFLAVPDKPVTHRVRGLFPSGGRVVLSAPHKAGKTTFVGNLLRCLADGEPFLGEFDTIPARVVLLDNELDEDMLRRWLRDHGTTNPGRVHLAALRGRVSAFNIIDPTTRARWAEHLSAARADVLVLDCLRPVLDALGLSEDKDAGRLLEALDELTRAAGIPEAVVVHHTGHAGERSRGDSRIQDWPDAVWQLTKDKTDDDTSAAAVARYFTAYGRDVDQPQVLLGYEPETRRLRIAGGSKSDTMALDALEVVLDLLAESPGLSQRQVWERAQKSGHARATVFRALALGKSRGDIETLPGARNSTLHYPSAPVRHECAGTLPTSAPVPLIDGALTRSLTDGSVDRPTAEHSPNPQDGRTCPECGDPLPPGKVRHPECFRAMEAAR